MVCPEIFGVNLSQVMGHFLSKIAHSLLTLPKQNTVRGPPFNFHGGGGARDWNFLK